MIILVRMGEHVSDGMFVNVQMDGQDSIVEQVRKILKVALASDAMLQQVREYSHLFRRETNYLSKTLEMKHLLT